MLDPELKARLDALERDSVLALDQLTLRDGFHARGECGLVMLLEQLANVRQAGSTVPGPSALSGRIPIGEADVTLWELALMSAKSQFCL